MTDQAVYPDFSIDSLRDAQQLSSIAHRFGHDIGNLLTSIVSFSSVIKRVNDINDIEKLPNYCDAILREAWRVNLFNERLVMLLSDRDGSPEVVSLESVISRARHKLRARLHTEIECEFVDDPSRVFFEIDLDQCTALLVELLLNVFLHSNSKKVSIATFENTETFGFTLTNAMAHVPTVDLQQLFHPFVSWPDSCKSSGIGLTIAHAITHRAGASIALRTSKEPEPTFSVIVSFPIGKKPVVNEEADGIEEMLEIPAALPQCINLLLIEDQVVVSSAIEKILTLLLGSKTTLTIKIATGTDAYDQLNGETSFDVVLCDLNLKESSGQQIFRHIQKSQPQLVTRFAFITGDRGKQSAISYLESTGRPFLFKPFEPEDLLDLVFELLAENR